jgi:uncharacterized protein YvpB
MRKIHQSIAVLALAFVGPARCDQEQRAVGDANSVRGAEMQQIKDVVASAKQITIMVTPFYGEANTEKFFTLLAGHVAAVKEYSEATVAVEFRYDKSDQNVFLRDNVGINKL